MRTAALPPNVFVTPARPTAVFLMRLHVNLRIFSSQPLHQPLHCETHPKLFEGHRVTPPRVHQTGLTMPLSFIELKYLLLELHETHQLSPEKMVFQCPPLAQRGKPPWALPNHCSHWICEKHGSQNLEKRFGRGPDDGSTKHPREKVSLINTGVLYVCKTLAK